MAGFVRAHDYTRRGLGVTSRLAVSLAEKVWLQSEPDVERQVPVARFYLLECHSNPVLLNVAARMEARRQPVPIP